tara:strand:- start:20558 stop:22039 length:1482 start_codon:yes stop_codon:yes gene_type:complete
MKYFMILIFFVANFSFGQKVSLGKDGKVYDGVWEPISLLNGPMDLELNKFHNIYHENGIKFSVKLVIGNDARFKMAEKECEPLPYVTNLSAEQKKYAKIPIYYYRLVLLIENENATKEVEFLNSQAFFVEMEVFDSPPVQNVCNTTDGTYFTAATGNIELGSNSSIEICDPDFGGWFFSKPKLDGLTISKYVLRSENAAVSQSKVKKNATCVIPATYLKRPRVKETVSKIRINDQGDRFWNTADKIVSEKVTSFNPVNKERVVEPVSNANPFVGKWYRVNYCKNLNDEVSYIIFNNDGTGTTYNVDCKNTCEGYAIRVDFNYSYTKTTYTSKWTSVSDYCGKPNKLPTNSGPVSYTIVNNVLETPYAKFVKKNTEDLTPVKKQERNETNAIIGKWSQISGNYGTNKNGVSNYFYFGPNGQGYTFVPDTSNRCPGYGVKTHFKYNTSNSNISLSYTKQDPYCGTSGNVQGKSASASYRISGNVITISGIQFKRQ